MSRILVDVKDQLKKKSVQKGDLNKVNEIDGTKTKDDSD